MSRKKSKRKMSKQRFKSNICAKCRLCTGKFSPTFCYNELYKQDRQRFINVLLPKLIAERRLLKIIIENNASEQVVIPVAFNNIFCNSNICKEPSCNARACSKCNINNIMDNITGCIGAFRKQVNNEKSPISKYKNNYIKKSTPVVTMICSDNKEFHKEVEQILANNT